ncbi:MAG: hypothetical protein WBM48_11180, partial [Polyangiales bacterium]
MRSSRSEIPAPPPGKLGQLFEVLTPPARRVGRLSEVQASPPSELAQLDAELYRLARGAGRLRLRIGQALH